MVQHLVSISFVKVFRFLFLQGTNAEPTDTKWIDCLGGKNAAISADKNQ